MDILRKLLIVTLEWASLALGVFVASQWKLLTYNNDLTTLALIAMTLGILNSYVRPLVLGVVLIVSLPALLLTLGLAYYLVVLVTNGLIILLAEKLLDGFKILDGHWILAPLCISLVSWLFTSAVGIEQVKPFRRPQPPKDDSIDI
jgi:putative membrane protein